MRTSSLTKNVHLATVCRLLCLALAGLTGAASAAESLTLTFTTSNPGGRYGSRNVHAVWLEDAQGRFVTTVGNGGKRAVWGNSRAHDIYQWYTSNDDAGADIIARTGATESAYRTYTIEWDLTDRNGAVIPNGTYTLRFELTNDNYDRNYFHRASFTFQKNGVASRQGPLSQNGYSDVIIDYQITQNLPPTVVNTPAENVLGESAIVGGEVVDTGGQTPQATIYWGASDGGTDPAAWQYAVDMGPSQGAFSTTLTGLVPDTTYYFRCFAENAVGSDWADATESLTTSNWQTVFQEGDVWSYWKGLTHPGDGWNDTGFDDGGWLSGPAGIGYDDGDDQTQLNDMEDGYMTVYMRYAFSLPAGSQATDLLFSVDYDDGFVAYINGTEVARRNVPEGQDKDTPASLHHAVVDGGAIEHISLLDFVDVVRPGVNVFAIEVHNAGISSSDLTMIPQLLMKTASAQIGMAVEPAQVSFGPIAAGESQTQQITITSTGDAPIEIYSVTLVGVDADAYRIVSGPTPPFTIAAGASEMVGIEFLPTYGRTYYGQASIGGTDPDNPVAVVALEGLADAAPAMPLYVHGSVAGPCRDVLLDTGRLWAGNGASLDLYDVSDPQIPVQESRLYLGGLVEDLACRGDVVYAAMGPSGLAAVDFTSPTQPQVVFTDEDCVSARAIAVAGQMLYLADGLGGVRIYDLTNPAAPALEAVYATLGAAEDVAVQSDKALILDEAAGLLALDVSTPAAPTLIGVDDELLLGRALVLNGDTAMVIDSTGELYTVDISAVPTLLGRIHLGAAGNDLAVNGSFAFVATGSGLIAVDIADAQNPAVVNSLATAGEAADLATDGVFAWLAAGPAGVRMVRVSDAHALAEEGAIETSLSPTAMAAQGSTLLTGADGGPMDLLHLPVAGDAQYLAGLSAAGMPRDVLFLGDVALVANGTEGLLVLDVQNPAAPAVLGSVALDGFASGVASRGGTAFVAAGRNVYSLDLTDLAHPSVLDEWLCPGWAMDVAVLGDRVLVASAGMGLSLLDAANPADLQDAGSVQTDGIAYGVAVRGDVALVADGPAGLTLVDMQDPQQPAVLASFDMPGLTTELVASGSYVCVANRSLGLQVLDVSAPQTPQWIAGLSQPLGMTSVAVSGSRVVLTDSNAGLVVLGNTQSPILVSPDLSGDGIVDFEDFTVLADRWLQEGTLFLPLDSDLNGDGLVNLYDLLLMNDSWLEGGIAPTPDREAPLPDPLTWEQPPTAVDSGSITMTATAAVDESGVEYYFECVEGPGHDSGWQNSRVYVDTGLAADTSCSYRVRARDRSPAQNQTAWSQTALAETESAPDTQSPIPDPLTWDQAPAAAGTDSITMAASAADDESGVEYYFECVEGDGHDSGWQDSPAYTDTGLSPGTLYGYRVSARDKSDAQNQTAWSAVASTRTEPEQVPDEVITVLEASYEEGELEVEARSSRQPDVDLFLVGYGRMEWENDDGGKYEIEVDVSTAPESITIRSSLGTTVTVPVEIDDDHR